MKQHVTTRDIDDVCRAYELFHAGADPQTGRVKETTSVRTFLKVACGLPEGRALTTSTILIELKLIRAQHARGGEAGHREVFVVNVKRTSITAEEVRQLLVGVTTDRGPVTVDPPSVTQKVSPGPNATEPSIVKLEVKSVTKRDTPDLTEENVAEWEQRFLHVLNGGMKKLFDERTADKATIAEQAATIAELRQRLKKIEEGIIPQWTALDEVLRTVRGSST